MGSFSWQLPSPPALVPEPGTAADLLMATARTLHGPLLDLVIDPVTLDYVDTDNGDWLETADSRTLVMCQIEMRLGGDFYAPEDGTNIKDLLEADRPPLDEEIAAETRRALQVVANAGVIADVTVSQYRDEKRRLIVECNWRDVASGSPVDLVYKPYGES